MTQVHGSFRSLEVASRATAALADAGVPFKNPRFVAASGPRPDGESDPAVITTGGMGARGVVATLAAGAVVSGLAATGVGLAIAAPIAATFASVGAGVMAGSLVATLSGGADASAEAMAARGASHHGRVVVFVDVPEADVTRVWSIFAAVAAADHDASPIDGLGEEDEPIAAGRRYDAGAVRTVAAGVVARLGRDAQRAFDDRTQGPELRRAEAAALRGPMSARVADSRSR